MTAPEAIEFSRPITPESLGEKGKVLSIEANADERSRLAQRLGLDGLEALSAEIRLTPRSGGRMVRLEGTFRALVRQICVVTLEPVEDHIEGTVERIYDTTIEGLKGEEEDIDVDGEDPPDPLFGGEIDAGEAVAEQLALAINPFPRKKGTIFADYSTGPARDKDGDKAREKAREKDGGGDSGDETGENAAPSANPFIGLEKLKNKLKK